MTNNDSSKNITRSRKNKGSGGPRPAGLPGNGSRAPRSVGGGANPQQNFDRYVALARSAATSGNRVEAENYYQHAEHYFRLMNRTAGESV